MKVYAILGIVRFFRDEVFPARFRAYRISLLLPDWSWQTWAMIAALIASVAVLEGAYRQNRASEKASREKHPVSLASGEPYAGVIERGVGGWVVSLLIIIGIVGAWTYGRAWGPSKGTIPIDLESSVYLNCSIDYLPIQIAPAGLASIIRVNHSIPPSLQFGFFEVHNFESREALWPDATLLSKAFLGKQAYRCELSNHAHALQDLTITLAVDSTAQQTDGSKSNSSEYKTSHTVTINPFDNGSTFTFYFVNECKDWATIILPVMGIAQVPSTGVRQIPLRRFNRLPAVVESLISLFPSDVAWNIQPVCRTD